MWDQSIKNFIENYFDHSFELENTLARHGKDELLEKVETIHGIANIYYVLGLGHAILKANIEFGLRNPETSEGLKEYLKSIKI